LDIGKEWKVTKLKAYNLETQIEKEKRRESKRRGEEKTVMEIRKR
jgi:hypothetical protein